MPRPKQKVVPGGALLMAACTWLAGVRAVPVHVASWRPGLAGVPWAGWIWPLVSAHTATRTIAVRADEIPSRSNRPRPGGSCLRSGNDAPGKICSPGMVSFDAPLPACLCALAGIRAI
jgi:hypothetical protein